jgi:hypothetical protein
MTKTNVLQLFVFGDLFAIFSEINAIINQKTNSDRISKKELF